MATNWFTVKQLFPNIWGLAEFGHFEKVISYLFIGKEQALLFDTGMGIGNILREVRLRTQLPILVLNSHCHPDHIGGNRQFNNILQLHTEWGRKVTKSGYKNADLVAFTNPQAFLTLPPKNFNSNTYAIPSFHTGEVIKDGKKIKIYPFTFTVIATPGHSPDSLCLYEERTQILLTGDTIYPGPIYLFFKESHCGNYKTSIEKLSKIENIKYLLPAHNEFLQETSIIQKIKKGINILKYTKHSNTDIKINKSIQLICTHSAYFE